VLSKILDAEHSLKLAIPQVKFNWINTNATDAKPVLLDKDLLVMSVRPQDQPVLATNNTTPPPTDVITAHKVNYQVTAESTKMVDVPLKLKTAMLKVKDNLDNNNAMDAKLAQLDKFLETTTNVPYQDQFAHAIKQSTFPPTNARTAQLDNSVLTKVNANLSTNNVDKMDKFN